MLNFFWVRLKPHTKKPFGSIIIVYRVADNSVSLIVPRWQFERAHRGIWENRVCITKSERRQSIETCLRTNIRQIGAEQTRQALAQSWLTRSVQSGNGLRHVSLSPTHTIPVEIGHFVWIVLQRFHITWYVHIDCIVGANMRFETAVGIVVVIAR